jgi:hypothetical protein
MAPFPGLMFNLRAIVVVRKQDKILPTVIVILSLVGFGAWFNQAADY